MTIFYDNLLFAGYPRTCEQGGAVAMGEEKVIIDCFDIDVTRIFTMINDILLKMLIGSLKWQGESICYNEGQEWSAGAQVGESQATTSIQPPGE